MDYYDSVFFTLSKLFIFQLIYLLLRGRKVLSKQSIYTCTHIISIDITQDITNETTQLLYSIYMDIFVSLRHADGNVVTFSYSQISSLQGKYI